MTQPPRKATEPLLSVPQVLTHTVLGLLVGGLLMTLYIVLDRDGVPLAETRAILFTLLVSSTIGFVLALRQPHLQLRRLFAGLPGLSLIVLGVTVLCLWAITAIPMLANLFAMATLRLESTSLLALMAVGSVVLTAGIVQKLRLA